MTSISPGQKASSALIKETYPLIQPYSYALIQQDTATKTLRYTVVEVPLSTKEKETLKLIKSILIEELNVDFNRLQKAGEAEDFLKNKVMEVIKSYSIKISSKALDKINYHIVRDFVGLGPIEPMMRDHMIEEISLDGIGIPIYIWHRKYESIVTNVAFDKENELDSFVIKLAQRTGRHVSIASPLLDAALPDGSRINLTLGKEVTMHGSTFTIRKFRSDPWTVSDMIAFGTIDEDMAAFFWYALENRKSILIAGGTASGKTSLLNSLAMFIRPGLKIVSIEDTAELNLPHENWIPSVARTGFGGKEADGSRRGEITLFDLLRAALRQRPDYLFVGEVRGEEAYNMFQAMATGHSGMGTIHGDSVMGVIRRLESVPMNIPRSLVQTLDVVVVQRKVRRGDQNVRRSIEAIEIVGMDPVTQDLITNKVFAWNPRDDTFTNFGRSYILEQIQKDHGVTEGQVQDELTRRKTVLRWMVKKKMSHFSEVAKVIEGYYQNPDQTLDKAKKELKAV